MKKITTSIICITVILLFLVSSSGLSFVIHHCYTAKTEHIQLFAKTYQCKTETNAKKSKAHCSCSKHVESSTDKNLNHLGKSDCCKNTYQFLKLSYQYENGISAVKQIVAESPVILKNNALSTLNIDLQDNHFLYHSPPLLMFGNYLIHFIHSIKIPSPSYC